MSDLAFQQRQAKIRDVDFEYGTALAMKSSAWDYQTMYSCVCDSTWPVGFNSGERQLAEYFGPDCSLSKFFLRDAHGSFLGAYNILLCANLNVFRALS